MAAPVSSDKPAGWKQMKIVVVAQNSKTENV